MICRTCKSQPALYLDQCIACRQKSTVADDREYLKPGGEWERRQLKLRDDAIAALQSLLEMPSCCSTDAEIAENNRRREAARKLIAEAK